MDRKEEKKRSEKIRNLFDSIYLSGDFRLKGCLMEDVMKHRYQNKQSLLTSILLSSPERKSKLIINDDYKKFVHIRRENPFITHWFIPVHSSLTFESNLPFLNSLLLLVL